MPATEQTSRDIKLLHTVFGISSVVLLIATIWMFADDHAREWKQHQDNARHIDMSMTNMRMLQYETDVWQREHQELQEELRHVRAQGVAPELLEQFREQVREDAELRDVQPPNLNRLQRREEQVNEAVAAADAIRDGEYSDALQEVERLHVQLEEARQQLDQAEQDAQQADAAEARQQAQEQADAAEQEISDLQQRLRRANQDLEAAQLRLRQAESQIVERRRELLGEMNQILRGARHREDMGLQDRRFAAADLDEARAEMGLAVRDGASPEVLASWRSRVAELQQKLRETNQRYELAAAHREELQRIIRDATAEEDELVRRVEENEMDLERLRSSVVERRANFFEFYGIIPLPGKRWLELPILDAFNSPRQIETLWSDGLEQDINFRKVRRFDRCTTCHQSMQQTSPGTADEPAYVSEQSLTFIVDPRGHVEEDEARVADLLEVETGLLGVKLEDHGLLRRGDVTIGFVEPHSLAARARFRLPRQLQEPLTNEQLQAGLMQPHTHFLDWEEPTERNVPPGLLVGDVIEAINGDRLRGRERILVRLRREIEAGRPFELTVRRGLPHPYTSHPRLDLFVGSLSPHPMEDFACTICHDGQGSATEFKWADHTPNSERQREEWKQMYGWFDNHDWIYPMHPKRFAESSCLKCHHDVAELERSDKWPEAPAPTLTQGYHLFRQNACYGCHEVGGFDGPDKRVGPDLRLEPNYHAAAAQIKGAPDSGFEFLELHEQELVERLIHEPHDSAVRHQLLRLIHEDEDSEQPRLAADVHNRLAPLLQDTDTPGKLRRAGPSLRHVAEKLDEEFLYDWIRDPHHYDPGTRMPKFFGLWNHMPEDSDIRALSKVFEPMEVLGTVTYLKQYSQPHDFLEPPEGITETGREEQIERGRVLFQERGCLACHTHQDFSDAEAFRHPDDLVEGPDLSSIGDKFAESRNPEGRRWLYSWIKEPTRYDPRTVMPDLFLDPVEHQDIDGNVTMVTDPVADLVEYLMASSQDDWQPDDPLTEPDETTREHLDQLAKTHLLDAFFESAAERHLRYGIPERSRGDVRPLEHELIVPDEDFDNRVPLSDEQKLLYVGRTTLTKYGCAGCHDIPGFESATPIGTALSDWGLKNPEQLAFEHITQYVEYDHVTPSAGHAAGEPSFGPVEKTPDFYKYQLKAHNRIGFIYQKLTEPRSYDYHRAENVTFHELLRMPQFSFGQDEREAIMTFVLGLVADPPRAEYVYQPTERDRALQQGRVVLEKYQCGSCHVLEAEQWHITHPEGFYGPQIAGTTYPFVAATFSREELAQAAQPDRQNLLHAQLVGMPTIGERGRPMIYDDEGDPLDTWGPDDTFNPRAVEFSFDLWKPTILDGHPYQVGELSLAIPADQIESRYEAQGGFLTKYLLPYVVERERQINPNAPGSEAWGWLPPPLVGQGKKTQPEWLYQFLLDPHPIRPAVDMRMPKFNMSPEEATALVNYFAARDNVNYPYDFTPHRRRDRLADLNRQYAERLSEQGGSQEPGHTRRFEDAMRIVTGTDFCIQCHIVGDFDPAGRDREKAPDLSITYQRFRPDYLRQWLAKPDSILPYTGMPVNIPYDPNAPNLGGVSQDIYHGTSIEQLDALVDLLMNYDVFAQQRSAITPLVRAAVEEEEETEAGEEPAAVEAGGAE